MSKSIRLIFHLCLVASAIFAFSVPTLAADELADESSNGNIDVYYSAEALAPYKERKSNWSGVVGIAVDNYLPDMYRSNIGGGSYEQLFGTAPIPMAVLTIGTKYNFSLGSLGLSAHYGIGEVSDDRIGQTVKLQVQKKGAQATFTMDALFDEPYVAPYVGLQAFNIDYKEKDNTNSDSGSTAIATGVTVGLLLQLNALDSDSALMAQNSIGLDNTFLNLFLSQYNTSGSETDPNFQTSFNWGAGFLLDF